MARATKTIKLTKSQREVLTRAADSPKGRVYVQAWSRGSFKLNGRGSSGGLREHAAMLALVDLGLLDGLKQDHSHGRLPLGDLTVYSTEAIAFITDAGREAIR